MRTVLFAILILASSPAARAEDSLWKCHEPDRPFRFATSETDRDAQTPPCQSWIELRGDSLAQLFTALVESPPDDSNAFLAAAVESLKPGSALVAPIQQTAVFTSPEDFGFRVGDTETAPTGSLVLFKGLSGILVETRGSSDDPWSKGVFYAEGQGALDLNVSKLSVDSKELTEVLVPRMR